MSKKVSSGAITPVDYLFLLESAHNRAIEEGMFEPIKSLAEWASKMSVLLGKTPEEGVAAAKTAVRSSDVFSKHTKKVIEAALNAGLQRG